MQTNHPEPTAHHLCGSHSQEPLSIWPHCPGQVPGNQRVPMPQSPEMIQTSQSWAHWPCVACSFPQKPQQRLMPMFLPWSASWPPLNFSMYPSLMAWFTPSFWESSATNYLFSGNHLLICGLTITKMIIKPLLKHSQCINLLNAPLNFGLSPSDHWSQHYQWHLLPLSSCSLTDQHKMDA